MADETMRAIRFHAHGEPEDVLRLEEIAVPHPGPGQVRVAVDACGINPADWALCTGLFAGDLPRGIGLEVSGTVDELGDGVSGVAVGDRVFGPAPFTGASAGAADSAVLDVRAAIPDGLGLLAAAAIPMVAETATRALDLLGLQSGESLLVHGAGSSVGGGAVQLALQRGARVTATAGETHADALRAAGAQVTRYGEGMVERVRALAGAPDRALDASPVGGSLPDLVRLTGDADRVLTLSDFAAARELGARDAGPDSGGTPRNDVLPEVAAMAVAGRFAVPIAATFTLEQYPEALRQSRSGRAGGKLLFLVSAEARESR